MHPIVQNIEHLRKSKGVMKGHLARRCGKSPEWYSKMLKGNRLPSIDDLSAMADALGVEPGYFFNHERDILESLPMHRA